MQMNVLISIPCLNESETIGLVIQGVREHLAAMEGVTSASIVIVDDGSSDDTAILAEISGAKVLRHGVTRGVGQAFQTAVNYAIDGNFDIMLTMDGDNQFFSSDLPAMLSPLLQNKADFVTGTRFTSDIRPENMPSIKYRGNQFMTFLLNRLCGISLTDVSCGMRAYSRETLLQLNLHAAYTYTHETIIDLAAKKLRLAEVPVRVSYFSDRKSRVVSSITSYGARCAAIIFRTYRDYYPLKFFMSLSAINLILSLHFGLIFLFYFLETGKFSGYIFSGLLSGFFFIVGLILAVIAIVADMLVRLRLNQERILYLIRSQRESGHAVSPSPIAPLSPAP